MNRTNLIIKITSTPERRSFDNDLLCAEFVAKFYQYRKNKYTYCKVSVWGDLASDTLAKYNKNDFLFIEGYLSLQKSSKEELNQNISIGITVFKIYPYALTGPKKKK